MSNKVELPEVPEVMNWLGKYMSNRTIEITAIADPDAVGGILRIKLTNNSSLVMAQMLTQFCMDLKAGRVPGVDKDWLVGFPEMTKDEALAWVKEHPHCRAFQYSQGMTGD